MAQTQDLLLEIGCEELPPKALQRLSLALTAGIEQGLQKMKLGYRASLSFASPRRLAVIIKALQAQQDDYHITRQGPMVKAAYDADGQPTPACRGFAKSCGVDISELKIEETAKGERLLFEQHHIGQAVQELVPNIIENALSKLPIPKPMRWGNHDISFIRPVHWIVLLYGEELIPCTLLGQHSDRHSYGHRFHHPQAISIKQPADYAALLESPGQVIVDFNKRREMIKQHVTALAQQHNLQAIIEPDLLDEVTGLVEYPTPLLANFDKEFLQVPPEALIAAMRDHQKCFYVVDNEQRLQPHFITVSNIHSRDPQRVIHGNERVMRARLADAAFFYQTDLKQVLEDHLAQLKHVTFQAKLGSLYDKSVRLSQLTHTIAETLGYEADHASRAGLLSQCDLVTDMVEEFPELQGIMGYYYAQHNGESAEVALALKEQYWPRFAKDQLPTSGIGASLALAARIDSLVGIFGIGQIPTGEKDPFALRRAALGVVRIIIDRQLTLDLIPLLEKSVTTYGDSLENRNVIGQVQQFILDRMRAYYLEQGISVDVLNAVFAKQSRQLLDCHHRIHAVTQFRQLAAAKALAAANKRVSKLLQKEGQSELANGVDNSLLELDAEKDLALLIEDKKAIVYPLFAAGKYNEALTELATLREAVDCFFDHVMVIVDDEKIRHNRLALLANLRQLFLEVADISLLQSK